MLKGKTVILGVCGSVAAYKAANLASILKKLNCDVHVIMTKNAQNFVNPILFESLTQNKCYCDTFDRNFKFEVEHIELAKKADLMVVAPATAHTIGKLAHGLADDMLTTTALACKCKIVIAPAMNTNMLENEIVVDNINKLKKYKMEIIEPESGLLACKVVGRGKLANEQLIKEYILKEIAFKNTLKGKKILITAGKTIEQIDPVRFITNHSTGKMGYEIARICAYKGADVTLVTGETFIEKPEFVNIINVTSANEMFIKVREHFLDNDIIIKSAAVADYTPKTFTEQKIKKHDSEMTLELEKTTDILKYVGENKKASQYLCGFSMETENLVENSKKKLKNKNLDLIVANNLNVEGAGFSVDTNVVTLITKDKNVSLEKMSKTDVAINLIDFIVKESSKETPHNVPYPKS